MRGKFIRELIDRIDIRREEEYEKCVDWHPAEGSIDDAHKDLAFGRFAFLNGDYEESIRLYESAIEKYNTLLEKAGVSYALIYLSMNYREMRNFDEARNALRKANHLGVMLGDNYIILFSIINSLTLYSLEGRMEEGEELRRRAGSMVKDVGHPKLAGDYYNNAGQAYLNRGDYSKALEYLKMSYDFYLEHYRSESAVNLLIVRINTSYALIKMERFPEALREIEELERMVRNFRFDSALVLEIYARKIEIYESIGDYKNAYEYAQKWVECKTKWAEETTRRPRTENVELRQELENSQEKLFENNKRLKHNNELLEEIIKNNELVRVIGSKLTATYELDEIFEIISSEIRHFLSLNSLTVSFVEDDELVVRYATFIGVESLPLPYHIPLTSDEFMTVYCINHNVDVKIDSRDQFAKYVSGKDAKPVVSKGDSGHFVSSGNESAIYCRLIQSGRPIGILSIQNDVSHSYSQLEFDAVKAIASFISIAIINSIKNRQIKEKAVELEQLALLDPLTGLANRRAYRIKVEELKRKHSVFALMFGDLNHLKVINDNLGHERGDRYLIAISEVLKCECAGNQVFRLSGDEFATLIENISREELYKMVEGIKKSCSECELGDYPLSVAIGCAYNMCYPSSNIMFMRAETRMYLDKHDYYMEYGNQIERRTM